MATQDVAHRGVEQRIVRGKDRAAGDPEDDVDALLLEGPDQRLSAAQAGHARFSTAAFGTRLQR